MSSYNTEFDYLASAAIEAQNDFDASNTVVTEEAAGTAGKVPAFDGTQYVPSTLDGDGSGITVTWDAGTRTLEIALPQNLTTSGEPVFAGLTIGATGTKLTFLKQLSFTIDYGSVSAHDVLDSVQVFAGANPASAKAIVSAPDNVMSAAKLSFDAWVSDTDEITIRATNPTAGAIDPPSGDYLVTLFVF